MRRGHPGLGSWRNENNRHFGPRGGGNQQFRPSRPFGAPDTTRFSGPRYGLYKAHPIHHDERDNHDRNKYRGGPNRSQPRPHERHHEGRQILPLIQQRYHDNEHVGFNKPPYYDNGQQYTNDLGDVDLRQTPGAPQNIQRIMPWTNPPFEHRQFFEHRSPQKTPRRPSCNDGMPLHDYSGHRPPASDHYSATPGPNNSNNPYSRSVDDTVDIVRKRLMNRESQPPDPPEPQQCDQDMRINPNEDYEPQEQPKKKVQKQKLNIKSNCYKMKNKIVHQLFKMDKGKIHKLMDNPNSSSKFEYAINSLITESQISLNRHLRSVAEKSLSSSSDFVHNDSNTIYEDTFMKQMQGILDPQDTILLEDIKPLVLAELSKVLQVEDFEGFEGEDFGSYSREDQSNYSYYNELSNEQFQENCYNIDQAAETSSQVGSDFEPKNFGYEEPKSFDNSQQLFERRPEKKTDYSEERTKSIESRKSVNIEKSEDKFNDDTIPLFDSNTEQLSEDDDPFADLDNQYHVAVDPNFIENEDLPVSPVMYNEPPTPMKDPDDKPNNSTFIKKEIVNQRPSMSQSPLKLLVNSMKTEPYYNENGTSVEIKNELAQMENEWMSPKELSVEPTQTAEFKNDNNHPVSCTTNEKTSARNSRKRSIDQKSSHRKEKRKKSSHSECHDTKPTTNYFSRDDHKDATKSYKRSESTDKSYSDKYVKRKDSHRKSKDHDYSKTDVSKKQHTTQPLLSPEETSLQTPQKDTKAKLKTFDMFLEPPKNSSRAHQTNRNTATPLSVAKSPDENKPKPIIPIQSSFARKLAKRHVGTQVIKKIRSKDTQTVTNMHSRATQTINLGEPTKKPILTATDPFKRMKEIDLEIQILLQEKFKLYNSLELKSKSNANTMGDLGMAVLDVPLDSEQSNTNENLSEDTIVDDFANIPVEELEQIAMESVQMDNVVGNKKKQRQKKSSLSRNNSESPTCSKRNRKIKTPNISLIEQIITDERPLEDIISLDDLEQPVLTKKKQVKTYSKSKKKAPKKKKTKPTPIPKQFRLRDCSVLLIRTDYSNYLNRLGNTNDSQIDTSSKKSQETAHENKTLQIEATEEIKPVKTEFIKVEPKIEELPTTSMADTKRSRETTPQPVSQDEIEETIDNDLQFDMLDVCEDIVLDDDDNDSKDKEADVRVPINEEIILDNSQSSIETVHEAIQSGNECKTYDYSTDENLRRDSMTVVGNADAVLAIECIENDFIAACLDGNVYHFKSDGQLVNTLRGSNLAVTCLTIVKEKYGTTVYTGSLDSRIRYYDLETGLEKGPECNVLSPIQTMDRAWDTVFVGTRTGFVLQFECKNNMLIPISTVKFSEQSILALRAMREGPRKVLLVASRSEEVTIKDAQTGLLLRTLNGPKMTVYTLLFEDGKVYCGTSSNQIHVFDYASGSLTGYHEGGKGAVCLRASGGLLFAGCYDGCIYVYRDGETKPLAQLRGPSLMLLSLAIVGSKIIAGYKDRSLYIWKIPSAVAQEMIL